MKKQDAVLKTLFATGFTLMAVYYGYQAYQEL